MAVYQIAFDFADFDLRVCVKNKRPRTNSVFTKYTNNSVFELIRSVEASSWKPEASRKLSLKFIVVYKTVVIAYEIAIRMGSN